MASRRNSSDWPVLREKNRGRKCYGSLLGVGFQRWRDSYFLCDSVAQLHCVEFFSSRNRVWSWCTTPPSPTSSSSLRTVGFVGLALAILALSYIGVKMQRTFRSTPALRMFYNTTFVAIERDRELAATGIAFTGSAIELHSSSSWIRLCRKWLDF